MCAGSRSTPSIVTGASARRKRPITDVHRLPEDAIGRRRAGRHSGVMTDRLLLPSFIALWASGYVVGAVAIDVADPLPLLAARFTLAALLLVPLALRGGRWRGAPLKRIAVIGVLLQVLQFGGVYGGFALGVPAALSALVMLGLSPLVTTALAVASHQEWGDARLWTRLAVGVIGVAVSLAPALGSARVGAGVGLTVLAMLGLSSGTVLQKRWAGDTDPRVSAAVQSVTAAVLIIPVALAGGGHVEVGPQLILSVAWISWGMGALSLVVLIH